MKSEQIRTCSEQEATSEPTPLVSFYLRDCADLPEWQDRRNKLKEWSDKEGISIRSAITTLSKAGVYIPKPKFVKKNPSGLADSLIERYGESEKNLEKLYGKEALLKINEYSTLSKEVILKKIEEELQLPENSLYSLRAGTKLSLVALLVGIS